MKTWIPFITFWIGCYIGLLGDYEDYVKTFWLGCLFLSAAIFLRNLNIPLREYSKAASPFPITIIIMWIFAISCFALSITEYLYGDDSLAYRIVGAPVVLIIGVPLIFLLIGGLLGGSSSSSSTEKSTTYSVKGTLDGIDFKAKVQKDK